MAREEWRYIDGFEGIYMISNLGRIYEAANAYNKKAVELFGEYAYLN